MVPSHQLDDRQKWSRLRAASSCFPGQRWLGLMGVFSPGEVSQRTLFPQAASSGTVLSWPLSKWYAYLPSHLVGFLAQSLLIYLPRAWSYKMLTCGINFYWLPWRDHSIAQVWALRRFKKRLLWWGTAIGVYKWLLIMWCGSPSTLYYSSFPVHQICPDFHCVEVVWPGLPLWF